MNIHEIILNAIKTSYTHKVLIRAEEFVTVAERIAKDNKLPFVNLHELLKAHLEYRHYLEFGAETVHPNERGVMVIAEALAHFSS